MFVMHYIRPVRLTHWIIEAYPRAKFKELVYKLLNYTTSHFYYAQQLCSFP